MTFDPVDPPMPEPFPGPEPTPLPGEPDIPNDRGWCA
jgi:hypothetical protein